MQNNASATTVFDGLLIFHSSFSYVIQLNPNNLVMTRFQSFMAKSHESSHIFLGQFSTRARPLAKELAGFLSGRQYGDPVASCRGELCELPDERALQEPCSWVPRKNTAAIGRDVIGGFL